MNPTSRTTELIPYFKSIKFIQYYYFIGALCLIFLLSFEEINTIFSDSFSEAGYISKDTGIWGLAILLFFRSLNSERILNSVSNLYDIIFLGLIFLGFSIFTGQHAVILPTLLLASIWYYSADQKSFSTILITWLYLLLSLPYNYYTAIIPELQRIAVIALEWSLNGVGIPVLVQEYFIAIPRGQFAIEEGCSGLKFLSVNLVLLFLYSVLSKFNLRQFCLAFIITVFISLLLNWVRILIIVVTAHNWGFDVPYLVKDHADFGWVVYTLFLIPMFYFYLLIDRMKFGRYFFGNIKDKLKLSLPPITLLVPIFLFAAI